MSPLSVPPRRAPLRVCAALTLAAVTLSACSSPDFTLPAWPTVTDDAGDDLPAGATMTSATADPSDAGTSASAPPVGSLPPDDRTAAERVPQIIDRGRLIVGVAQSLNGLGFRDPVTGDLAGFEVDLAREIARDIFGDPTKVDFRYVESTRRDDALTTGDVDLIIRTMTVTRDRQDEIEFSTPYLTTGTAVLAMRDAGIDGSDDLAGRTVCVARDSTSARRVWTEIPHGDVLLTQTWPDCLMAAQRHQVDAVFSDSAILAGLRAQDPHTEFVDLPSPTVQRYAVAAASSASGRDTGGLIRQVNATVERIRDDGTWRRSYDRRLRQYLGPADPPPLSYRTEAQSADLARSRAEVRGNRTREEQR